MLKKPNGKHLNEHQCCEIISKLSKTNASNKRDLAREYSVNEGAIWKVWDNREAILERFALLSEEAKERTFWASVGWFTELEDMLYIWIDSMHCAKLLVSPSLAIAKAKNIASSLSISKSTTIYCAFLRRAKPKIWRFCERKIKNVKGLRRKKNLPNLRCLLHRNLWLTSHRKFRMNL